MSKKIRNRMFWESAERNTVDYQLYLDRMTELAISMFEWKNVPDTVDLRFLELCLFGQGMAIFFYDDVLGYLALRTMIGGRLNVYNIPIERTAYASNGFNQPLDDTNSVIIFNNLLHKNGYDTVENFAKRLYNIDRAIDVNVNAQKTPILISCDETQRLTLKNMYMQYEGNMPFIFGDKNLSANMLKAINTGAPYVADQLYTLKIQIWNEFLTYQGISNINSVKKERMITDEVARNQGGVIANRYSKLEARREACKQINKMFGLDMWCDFREDYQLATDNVVIAGEPNSEGGGDNVAVESLGISEVNTNEQVYG